MLGSLRVCFGVRKAQLGMLAALSWVPGCRGPRKTQALSLLHFCGFGVVGMPRLISPHYSLPLKGESPLLIAGDTENPAIGVCLGDSTGRKEPPPSHQTVSRDHHRPRPVQYEELYVLSMVRDQNHRLDLKAWNDLSPVGLSPRFLPLPASGN
ncbi:hypothetical protein HPG69_014035, partial [Diceros bicornis minor]